MTRDNAPEMLAALDRLDAAVRAAPPGDTTAQIALWQQAARLETWFFVARGAAHAPRPFAVAPAQGPMICLYSSAGRARDAARSLGLVAAEADADAVPVLAVPMPAAIDYVASFGEVGVVGVTLDHPRTGHSIPLANLGLLKGWLAEGER